MSEMMQQQVPQQEESQPESAPVQPPQAMIDPAMLEMLQYMPDYDLMRF
jgi:hypothetical protein